MPTRHTIPNDRARHPWDRPAPEPAHPATRPLRWAARLGVLGLIAASLYPAIGQDAAGVDVAVSCDPATVGVQTTCTAVITEPLSTTYDSEQGMTKPIAPGVFTRGTMPSAGTAVAVATVNVNWSALEATRDVYTLGPIESQLDTAEARGLAGVRLRVMLGRYSPDWAKAIGDGPVTYTHVHGEVVTGTVPDLWDPNWQAEAGELFAEIAAEYDADPRLRLIFATGGMTWYGEPLLRAVAYEPNRANFLAAGYTRAADEALQRAQLDWLKVFELTPVGLAYNPYQFIRADGTAGNELTFVASLMNYHLANFGARTVLQNNSIRSSYIGAVPPLYQLFLDRVSAPGTTSYQTAAAVRIGDADATMHWAIDYLKASGVELVDGYPNFHTDAELTEYDTALKANDPPSEQPTTHAVSWSTSGDGTFGASTCTSDGVSATTCRVRYTPAAGSAGPHTITAIDASDSGSVTASGSTAITVKRRASTTTVACTSPVAATDASTCTATVADANGGDASAPTGPVTFSSTGGGSLGSPECSLEAISGSKSTCSVTYTPIVEGEHAITGAFGGDADHRPSSSAHAVVVVEPTVVVDDTAPVVEIVSPADGSTIKKGRTIEVVATATDDVGVINVEFAADGVVMCSDVETTAMTCAWSVPRNRSTGFTVTVTAWDEAGNVGSQQIQIATVNGRP
jgi:Bacterial Ig domain/Bacterial Ig-like domain (group 3)